MTQQATFDAITYRDLVRAEVTKIVTSPASAWTFVAVLVLNTTLGALASSDSVRISSSSGLIRLSDLGGVMFAPVYLFLVIPVFAAADEYLSGQYRITLTAIPDRRRLLVSKLAGLATVIFPAALLDLLPGRLIVGTSHGLGGLDIATDLGRWTGAYILMSCIAYGLATLLRSRVAPLAILALVPLLLATGALPWPALVKLLPDQLSLNVLGTPGYEVTAMPAATALLFLLLWCGTLIAAHAAALLRRDS